MQQLMVLLTRMTVFRRLPTGVPLPSNWMLWQGWKTWFVLNLFRRLLSTVLTGLWMVCLQALWRLPYYVCEPPVVSLMQKLTVLVGNFVNVSTGLLVVG